MEKKSFLPKENLNEENENSVKKISNKSKLKCLWLALIIILFGCCLIGLILFLKFYPGCSSKLQINWWQKEIFYQIEVSNFKDANGGDGIGDIDGI